MSTPSQVRTIWELAFVQGSRQGLVSTILHFCLAAVLARSPEPCSESDRGTSLQKHVPSPHRLHSAPAAPGIRLRHITDL